MATTNAALVQANNALKKLNTGANAQAMAEAGVNVSQNVAKMQQGYTGAAAGFRGVANKMNSLNLASIASNFKTAANAAESAAAAKSARSAANGLNKLKNAMAINLKKVNNGQMPANGAGVA